MKRRQSIHQENENEYQRRLFEVHEMDHEPGQDNQSQRHEKSEQAAWLRDK